MYGACKGLTRARFSRDGTSRASAGGVVRTLTARPRASPGRGQDMRRTDGVALGDGRGGFHRLVDRGGAPRERRARTNPGRLFERPTGERREPAGARRG